MDWRAQRYFDAARSSGRRTRELPCCRRQEAEAGLTDREGRGYRSFL